MAWSRVQGKAFGNTGSDSTIAVTLDASVTNGSLLVGCASWSPASVTVSNITDNQSNTYQWTELDDTTDDQGNVRFYCLNITNAPTTITITLSATASFRTIVVDELTNSGATASLVGEAGQVQASPGTGTDAISSGSLSGTTQNTDIIWGGCLGTGGGAVPTSGTGFTNGTSDNTLNPTVHTETKIYSSGSTAATFTQGVNSTRTTFAYSFSTSTEVPPNPTVWQFVGMSTNPTTASTTTTLTLSETGISGLQEGDLMIAVVGSRTTATTDMTWPAGWTQVGSQQKTNNTLTTTGAIASGGMAYIIRGSSAPALGVTLPAGISVAYGRIVAYRNVHPGKVVNTSTSATTATNTTSVSVAGITTTEDNCLIVMGLIGGQEATWTNFDAATDPTTTSGANSGQTANPIVGTWQERADFNTTSGADMSVAIGDAVKSTAGATGNFTATASLGAGHVVVVGAFNILTPARTCVVSRQAVARSYSW